MEFTQTTMTVIFRQRSFFKENKDIYKKERSKATKILKEFFPESIACNPRGNTMEKPRERHLMKLPIELTNCLGE